MKRASYKGGVSWIVAVLLFGGILLTTASCNTSKRALTAVDAMVQRDCDYFETKQIVLEYNHSKNAVYSCSGAASGGGLIAIVLNYWDIDTGEMTDCAAIIMTSEGEQVQALSLRSSTADFAGKACVYLEDGRFAILGYSPEAGNMILILSTTGDMVEDAVLLPDIMEYLNDILATADGWLFLSYEHLIVADMSGSVVYRLPIEAELLDDELFFVSDKPSVWVMDLETIHIQSLDIESRSFDKVSIDKMINVDGFMTAEKNGAHIIDYAGVFRLDLELNMRVEVASWHAIDVPPSASVYNMPKHIIMNEDTILRVVQAIVPGRSDELCLMIHRDINPNADKKTLTIGGYGVTQGDLLNYAVYLYNTGDYDYRIELVEYNDKYRYEDNESLRQANLKIITDMSEGNGDDMLAGIFFDFDTLGRSGTVLDIMSIATSDPDFETDDILPSVLELLKSGDKLYQIAPSFTISGFVGYSELLTSLHPMTIDQMTQVAGSLADNQYLIANSVRSNLASLAIQYRLEDFMTEDGKFDISTEELEAILTYADAFGIPDDYSGQLAISNPSSAYVTEKLLLIDAFINSPYDYNQYNQIGNQEMRFYGIPSLYDSARICAPRDLLAISAASEDPEACWEFIKLLFSLEAQQRAMLEDCIPVTIIAFEEQIQKAMDPSLMTPDDKVAAMFSNTPKPMSPETAEQYRDCVDSLNAINCYNVEIGNILWEEYNSYFYDDKPIQDVRATLNSRINLYLAEQ